MMKTIISIVFLSLLNSFCFAQQQYEDVVYLKNGNIIRGVIIEQIPQESIKIQTFDRNVFNFKMEEIEKMTREIITTSKTSSLIGEGFGYKGIIELGYDIGFGKNEIDRIRFNFINGFQVNQYISIGIGTGMRYFSKIESLFIPLFLDLRSNILDENVSPYVAVRTGLSMRATENFGIGFLINPTLGASFKISSKSSVNMGFGYDLISIKNPYLPNQKNYNYSALSFNLGVTF